MEQTEGIIIMRKSKLFGATTNKVLFRPKEINKFDLFASIIINNKRNLIYMKSPDYYADRVRKNKGDIYLFYGYLRFVIHEYEIYK